MTEFALSTHRMWSLGKFNPKLPKTHDYTAENDVNREFDQFMRSLTVPLMRKNYWNEMGDSAIEDTSVRSPSHIWSVLNARADKGDTLGWHSDGSSHGSGMYMAVWSNTAGTLARTKSGRTIYQAAPREVLVINNSKCVHRPPTAAECNPKTRWFARAYLHPDAKVFDRPGLFALTIGGKP